MKQEHKCEPPEMDVTEDQELLVPRRQRYARFLRHLKHTTKQLQPWTGRIDQKGHGTTWLFNQEQWKNFYWITFKRRVKEKKVACNNIPWVSCSVYLFCLQAISPFQPEPTLGCCDTKDAKGSQRTKETSFQFKNLFPVLLPPPYFCKVSVDCAVEGYPWERRKYTAEEGFWETLKGWKVAFY